MADTWGVFSSGREITTPDGKLDRLRVLVPDLRHEDTTAETGGEGGMNRRRGAAPPLWARGTFAVHSDALLRASTCHDAARGAPTHDLARERL